VASSGGAPPQAGLAGAPSRIPAKAAGSASRALAMASAPGGATASRGPRRSAGAGRRTDIFMPPATTSAVQASPLAMMAVSCAVVGAPGLRSEPATAATTTAASTVSARTRALARATRRGSWGSDASHTAPLPSRQNAFTPNSSPRRRRPARAARSWSPRARRLRRRPCRAGRPGRVRRAAGGGAPDEARLTATSSRRAPAFGWRRRTGSVCRFRPTSPGRRSAQAQVRAPRGRPAQQWSAGSRS
jgi:hypothetical protein